MVGRGYRSIEVREKAGMPLVGNALGEGPAAHSEAAGHHLENSECGHTLLASSLAHRSGMQGERFDHQDRIRIY